MTEEQLINGFKESYLRLAKKQTNNHPFDEQEVMYGILDGEWNEDSDEFEFIQDNTEDVSDSYGWTDDKISLIFKHKETGRFLDVRGTRRSYSGTEFQEIKEVFAKTVEQIIYE